MLVNAKTGIVGRKGAPSSPKAKNLLTGASEEFISPGVLELIILNKNYNEIRDPLLLGAPHSRTQKYSQESV